MSRWDDATRTAHAVGRGVRPDSDRALARRQRERDDLERATRFILRVFAEGRLVWREDRRVVLGSSTSRAIARLRRRRLVQKENRGELGGMLG